MNSPSRRRPGRPAGGGNTREVVLDAARRLFTERGFDGASLRAIAAEAGVDPGMVRHFFGDKDGLFRAVVSFPMDPAVVLPELLAPGPEGLGERIARMFFSVWEGELGPSPFVAIMRSAASHEESAALLRDYASRQIVGRIAAALDHPQAELRTTLAASQLIGLGWARYVVKLEPLASAEPEVLIKAVAPTIQRYITGDVDCPGRAQDHPDTT